MSTFRTEIVGVPVLELARQFGTPTFVYDAAMIRRRVADLSAFDVVRYAQKSQYSIPLSNSNEWSACHTPR